MAQTFSLQEALEEQKPTEQTTFSLEDALGPKIRSKERSWGDAALDVPAVGLSGVGSLLRVPGQLIKLAPGLQGVGEALEAPGKAIAEFGEGLKSEGLKVREALRSEAISEAEKEGILSEFVTALKYTIKDPALLSSFFIEQLPLLIGPAGAAKAVQIAGTGAVRAAGKGLTGEAAELATKEAAERLGKRATGAAVGAGTAMQTADIASETFDRAYDVAIKQGMSKEEANDAALNAARLAAPGAALTSLIATKGLAKLGGAAIERRLAGLPGTGRLRTAGGEAVSEGLEEAGGALAGNIGVRTVDPTQSLTAGVGSAAGLGVLGGGVLGGVLGGKAKPELAPGQLEGEDLYQTARRLHTEIGELDALAEKAKEQENRQLVELKTDAEVANLYRTEGVEGVERYQKELLQKSVAVEATPEEREQAKQASSAATKLMKQIDTSNVIAHRDLMAMGVSQKDRLYKELIGKDMVADSSPIINSFAKALSRPDLSQQQRENISAALTNINEYVGSGGVDSRNVGESVRRSLGLVGVAPERPAARGVEGTAPAGVAPTEEYAGEPLGRAAVKPSPIGEDIEKAPRAAPTAPITEEVQAPPAAPAAEAVARREPTQATEESAVERFAPEEVEKARVPDYKSRERLIEMPIDEFLQLADTVTKREPLSFVRQKMDNARDLVRRNVPFSSLPMLMYSDGRVDGHEGRHRALALREAGYKTMPVRLRSSDIRWDRQNDPSDPDYIRQWPTRLQAQENAANPNFSIPFPVKREESARPYEPVKRSLKPETEKRAEEILRQQDEEERQAKQAPETAEPVAEKTRVEQFAEARKDLVNQLDGVLKRILAKYGLKDVKLNINEAMEDEGSYARQIITLALNVDNPVRVLRHESIHALKDMGFFAPAQWNALVKRANEEWIDVLKNTVYNEATGASRYDAYQDLFAAEGANKGLKGDALTKYINESIVEEAIADAFGAYDTGKPPAGMIAATLTRMRKLFKAIKEAFGIVGIDTAEDVFGKIEEGKLKPNSEILETAAKAVKPSLRVMRGEEKPKLKGKPSVNTVGKYFDDQILEEFGRQLDYNNPEDFARAVKIASDEVAYQLKKEKSGLDWYEEDVKEAFKQTAKIIPELKKTDNRLLFSVMAGIMSPQTNARDNWFIAAKAFQHYVSTGTIPGMNPENGKLWQGGTQSANKKVQLDFLNKMVEDMGQKKALEWLFSDHTVKEINEFRSKYGNIKSGINGKLTDIKPGLYAFGPKVGPFVSNLNGIHDVTVDKWMTRTFNRYFGTMVDTNGEIIDAPTEPQRRAVKQLVNEVAEDAGIKPYQVQSLLWFYEQRLFTEMGVPSPSYGFSDGGKKFFNDARGRGGEPSGGAASEAVEPKRLSLRTFKDLFDKAADIPQSEGVEIIRENWIGGVSGIGERNSAYDLPRVQGGRQYMNDVQDLIRNELGDTFKGYRLMHVDELEEIMSGSMGSDLASFTLLPEVAQKFSSVAALGDIPRDQLAVVEMNLTPEHIWMFGHRGEREVVVNYGEGYSTAEVIATPLEGEKLSLRSPLGFYSALAKGVNDIKTASAPAQGWKDAIKGLINKGTVKADEVEWSGINDWLDLQKGKVTKDRVQEYLEQGGVRVEETVLGDRDRWRRRLDLLETIGASNLSRLEREELSSLRDRRDEEGSSGIEESEEARYQSYTLPGGENYREILLTLPSALKTLDEYNRYLLDLPTAELLREYKRELGRDWDGKELDPGTAARDDAVTDLVRARDRNQSKTTFKSPHWEQPNVLAHIRVNDRTDEDGERVLFVEEIQSDWGQEGKKKGFAQADAVVAYNDYIADLKRRVSENIMKDYTEEGVPPEKAAKLTNATLRRMENWNLAAYMDEQPKLKELYRAKQKAEEGIPTAPFVTKTEGWLNLALKRIITMAAEGGYDKVAFVNGEQSADRYNLSKQVDKVVWNEKAGTLAAQRSGGDTGTIKREGVTRDNLADIIGKEPAQRLIDAQEFSGWRSIDGSDLKVGGEGMKTFYDKIVPTALNKLLPKVGGGKLGEIFIAGERNNDPASGNDVMDWMGIPEDEQAEYWANLSETERDEHFNNYRNKDLAATAQPGFDVTPAMREKAGEGLPLFSLRSPTNPQFKFWFGNSKVVDENGEPKVMYHGTGKDYEILSTARRAAGAIFVSDEPQFADKFAKDTFARASAEAATGVGIDDEAFKQGVDKAIAQIRKDYGRDPMGRTLVAEVRKGYNEANAEAQEYLRNAFKDVMPAGPNIIPVYIKSEYPFDYENDEHVAAVRRVSETKLTAEALKTGNWEAIEDNEIQAAIRVLGFDGFYVKEQGKRSLGVYDPNQVKSVFNEAPTERPELRMSLRGSISPQLEKTLNKIVPKTYRPNRFQRILDSISGDGFTAARAQIVNRYEALARLDRAVAQQIKQAGGIQQLADQKAESAALFSDLGAGLLETAMGAHDRWGGAPVFRNGMTTISNFGGKIKGPIRIFKPLSDLKDPDAFRMYQLWSSVKRGKRLTVEGRESAIDAADIAVVDAFATNPGNANIVKLFERVQKDWLAYNDALVKFMEDTGVISKAMGKAFTEHGDYFPFYRLANDQDVVGPKMFTSIGNVKPPKKLKGGEAPLGDFFENIVLNSRAAIQAGIKNVASQRATEQALRVQGVVRLASQPTVKQTGANSWDVFDGNLKIGEVDAGSLQDAQLAADRQHKRPSSIQINMYRVMEKGNEVFYRSADPLFIDALKSLNMPDLPFLGALFSGPANLLRNLVTKDPAFMLANMMRDSLAAYVTTGVNMTPVVDTLKNFTVAIAGKSPEMQRLYAAGVLGGYDYSVKSKDAAATFEKRLREVSGAKTIGETLATPFTSLWGALEKGTQASDAATRIEMYKKTLAKTGNEAEAYWQALEVMNFNRHGSNPVIRIMTAAIPFLNARMQGLDLLYRKAIYPIYGVLPSWMGGPRGDATDAEIQNMKTFWVRGMTMASLSVLYWMMVHDDEDYKSQEQETRDNYWFVPGLGIKIPIPFEIGVLFKVVPERIAELAWGEDTSKDFRESMTRNLINTFRVNPIPQAVLPLYETIVDKSLYTGRAIVSRGMENIAPEYQIGPNTSRIAEVAGKAVGYSPMKIDHLIRGYTGTLGQYMADLIGAAYEVSADNPKPSKRIEQLPIIRRFATDPEARGKLTAFYELKNAVDEAVRTSNMLEKTMQLEELIKYQADNAQILAMQDYIKDLDKSLKEFRDTRKWILSMPMDPDDKRDTLVSIGQMERMLADNIKDLRAMAFA